MDAPLLEIDLTQQEPVPPAGVDAALALLASGRLHRYGETGGKPSEVSALEADFAAELGVRYCVAMNSCGSTMFIALKAAGVKPGDAVLSNCFTLAPVPGAIAHAGARPVLVDVTDDYTIDLADLERKVVQSGAKTLLLSHMRGHICDMHSLDAVCGKYGVQIIEDCAHTMGAGWPANPREPGAARVASACRATNTPTAAKVGCSSPTTRISLHRRSSFPAATCSTARMARGRPTRCSSAGSTSRPTSACA